MQRGSDALGGLGPQLVGERIHVNRRLTSVIRQLGEGGFSFVYLVKDISLEDETTTSSSSYHDHPSSGEYLVLKITSIHSRQQRDIAEKEAKLLSRLSHPSIIRMFDSCYRSIPLHLTDEIINSQSSRNKSKSHSFPPQHLILMEYCDGGTALSVCNTLKHQNRRFDLHSLIIAFGQICNAVSYLHAQRIPIVHRDLKPVNFLVKNGTYKLCDFGSAVFGHVDLRTSRARAEAEEVIQKTTTQMFRSPEMVDLYMAKKLTQSTDVWALGVCLYSLAFLQNCFEEGSNLAILSCNYKIPEDNPYGKDLEELIDRMLTIDCTERADMTEVILCLSAIYSGRPLPPRKSRTQNEKQEIVQEKERVGRYRTDGQGIRKNKTEEKKPVEAKKLNPNSAAARRRKAAQTSAVDGAPIPLTKSSSKNQKPSSKSSNEFLDSDFFLNDMGGFSAADNPFHTTHDDQIEFGAFKNPDMNSDGVFDFSSENDSGFDNFGSDDGSRSTAFSSLQKSIAKETKDATADISGLNFDEFKIEEGNKYRNKLFQDSEGQKRKKKGLFRKNRQESNEI